MDDFDPYEESKRRFIAGDRLYHAGKRVEAIEEYTRGLELAPQAIYGLVQRGSVRCELEDIGGAMADFEEAIAIDPTYGPAYYGRGWARSRLGDYTGELADARKGMELDPLKPARYWRRIGSALGGLGRTDEALAAYARAVEMDPDDEGTLLNRGILLARLNRLEEALAQFDRVLELDPHWDWGLRERGLVLGRLHRWDEALADHTELVTRYPDTPGYREILEQTKARSHSTTWRERLFGRKRG